MSTPLLATKLYVPQPGASTIDRARLIERLDDGLHRKLTLVSAPAGFGKTTVVSRWVAGCGLPVAWLSLDEADSAPARFLAYVVAALQTVAPTVGASLADGLQSTQPPATESLLTVLLNEVAALPDGVVLVLDDYHLVDSPPVDDALAFLLDHLPPQLHLVITTREDPRLPLARLRARGQMAELRAADLRFTPDEAASFLNEAMGLELSAEDLATLDTRTEGWIAGLQLAALSMRGRDDVSGFIRSFAGDDRFVVDYLPEEVLRRHHEGFALSYVASRVVESTLIIVGLISLLSAMTLRQDAAAESASLVVAGQSLVALHDWTFLLGPGFGAPIGNGLILGYLMFRSGLVPRRMAQLGLVGGTVGLASATATLLGVYDQVSVWAFIAIIPEFAWEASLGIWLTVKGFSATARALSTPKLAAQPAAAD